MKLKIRKGDTVEIISGRTQDKGKTRRSHPSASR